MASDKVKTLGIVPDYKMYLYYVDGQGRVCRKRKHDDGFAEVLDSGVTREKGFLYYLDKQGDISRSPMARRGAKV